VLCCCCCLLLQNSKEFNVAVVVTNQAIAHVQPFCSAAAAAAAVAVAAAADLQEFYVAVVVPN
jgi:hypothetical protein